MSILAEFVLRHAPHPENAASDALRLIVQESPAAMSGLVEYLDNFDAGEIEAPWIERESTGDLGERTDLSIHDADGEERAIIEVKFWAGLTERQPNTYIDRLRALPGRILLFLVPASRVESLWAEVSQRLTDRPHVVSQSSISLGARLPDGRAVHVTGWPSLLRALKARCEQEGDSRATSDLVQLEGLAERLDRMDFVPYRATDLAPSNAHFVTSAFQVVDDTLERLLRDQVAIRVSRKRSTSSDYYGYTVTLDGVRFWFGLWWRAWASVADTPFWLQSSGQEDSAHGRVVLAANTLLASRRLAHHQTQWGLIFPLYPPLAAERDTVINSLVADIAAVRDALGADAESPALDEAHRSSLAVAQSDHAEDDQAFIEAITDDR